MLETVWKAYIGSRPDYLRTWEIIDSSCGQWSL